MRPPRTSGAERAIRRSPALSASSRSLSMLATTTSRGSVVSTARRSVASGVSAPRKRIRHPCERSTSQCDQTDVVALAGRAGEDRERASTAAPQAREGEQPLADEVAGEVLLPDLELVPAPIRRRSPAAPGEEFPQDRLEGEDRPTPRRESLARLLRHTRAQQRGGARVALSSTPSSVGLACTSVRRAASAAESPGECLLHALDPRGVFFGVEAKAAFGSDRLEQPVAALPGAEELRANADPPRERADPQRSGVEAHLITLHKLDRDLTTVPTGCTVPSSSCTKFVERGKYEQGVGARVGSVRIAWSWTDPARSVRVVRSFGEPLVHRSPRPGHLRRPLGADDPRPRRSRR